MKYIHQFWHGTTCLSVLQGGYSPTGPGGAPSEYYGSIGYGTTYGAVSFGQMSWRGSQAQLWGGPGSPPSVALPLTAPSSNGLSPGSSPSTPSPARGPPVSNGRVLTTPRKVKAKSHARRKNKPPSQDPGGHSPVLQLPFSSPSRPMPVYMSTWAWSATHQNYFTSLPPLSVSKGRTTPRRSTPMNGPAYAGVHRHQFRRYRLITNNL